MRNTISVFTVHQTMFRNRCRGNKMKSCKVGLIVVIAIVFLGACATMEFRVGSRPLGPASGSTVQSLPSMRNNTRIDLDAGTYRASAITHNSVSVTGAGNDRTEISGTLVINGNNVRLANLTINGDVTINANNADLRNAHITGNVNNRGRNNNW